MVRFLADADFNHSIVKGCRRLEPAMDFLSANEAELEGVADPIVLAVAAAQGRVSVTHDRQTMPRHFGEFLASGCSSPGRRQGYHWKDCRPRSVVAPDRLGNGETVRLRKSNGGEIPAPLVTPVSTFAGSNCGE